MVCLVLGPWKTGPNPSGHPVLPIQVLCIRHTHWTLADTKGAPARAYVPFAVFYFRLMLFFKILFTDAPNYFSHN